MWPKSVLVSSDFGHFLPFLSTFHHGNGNEGGGGKQMLSFYTNATSSLEHVSIKGRTYTPMSLFHHCNGDEGGRVNKAFLEILTKPL